VRIVGDLPLSEAIILVLIVPLAVIYWHRAFRPDIKVLYILMGLWLLNQIVTDIYRRTQWYAWMRGDAGIIFFAIDLAFLSMLVGNNDRRKVYFFVAWAIVTILQVRFRPTETNLLSPWKFGYSWGVNLFSVSLCSYLCDRRRYLIGLTVLALSIAMNLINDYRSPILVIFMALALAGPVIPEQIGPWRVLPPPGSKRRLALLVIMAIIASVGSQALVLALSKRGVLGEEAQQKNDFQSHVKGGLIIGGRPEILVSSRAVLDSPILGHGSWAQDNKYVDMLLDAMIENGEELDPDVIEESSNGYIPAHSYLMGAWVWAGIFGGIFWMYVLWLAVKAIVLCAMRRPPYALFYVYMFGGTVWAILFSPFGVTARIITAMAIIMFLDVLQLGPNYKSATVIAQPRGWRRFAYQQDAGAPRLRPIGGRIGSVRGDYEIPNDFQRRD
jgi:hypothetical protein